VGRVFIRNVWNPVYRETLDKTTQCLSSWRNQAWLLKNSFQRISLTKFVRKLLNVRSLEGLKFTEITALVPFSTATGDYTH